ncbi:hypothetical protein QFC21_004195 [Naganishia friedmannii]|uniref:Uncharacterized protein n=1 Tax=Naganishia friedmannii TaxID=89922 RepID=A0ACC2VJY9_9TREE|nr:hypothetical protein QFC21_004195 [Naganishia friedmannii]
MPSSDLYTIPIAARPPHPTPLRNKLLFGPVFVFGLLGILGVQACFVPIGLVHKLWRRIMGVVEENDDGGEDGWLGSVYEAGVKGTKQLFGMLRYLSVTKLASPPSPTSNPRSATSNDYTAQGEEDKLLPPEPTDDTNGREYHHGSRTIVILLKQSLKWVPVVGWGIRAKLVSPSGLDRQFYRFIFLRRSWAQDQQNLTNALSDLARRTRNGAAGLWLLIFPEGTITSDNERAKSVRYAQREGIPDFVNLLHPRSTGLHFILETLAPRIPSLKLLDITIGYPGVPRGGYAQEWYGLGSVFWKGVAPPSVHVHMRLLNLAEVRGLTMGGVPTIQPNGMTAAGEVAHDDVPPTDVPNPITSAPDSSANTEFTHWLRSRWEDKEALLDRFTKTGGFARSPIRGEGEGTEIGADVVDEVEKRGLVKSDEVVLTLGLW